MTNINEVLMLIGGLALVAPSLHWLVRDLVQDLSDRSEDEAPPAPPAVASAQCSLPPRDRRVCGRADEMAPALERTTNVLPKPSTVGAVHVDLRPVDLRFC